MFLKRLTIKNGDSNIRNINFRKGVNLIVDETDSQNRQESGNNVGKTTVFRLIDFCLDGDGKNIYTDTEFKTVNQEIETFLKGNNIIVSLVLTPDFDDENNEIVIERNFLLYSQNIRTINGEPYGPKEFTKELLKLIFNTDITKPTFRQVISKNIRYEKSRLENTVKVLHGTPTLEIYESLYCFWLGIDFDGAGRKSQLQNLIRIEGNFQKKIKKTNDLQKIEQALSVIDSNIQELTIKKDNFQLNDNFRSDIDRLNQVKFEISQLSTEIARWEMRKELINESADNYNRQKATIDTNAVKHLYQEARLLMPNLQKTFEDTLNFHNQMVQEKIAFLTKELPIIELSLNYNKLRLNVVLTEEKALSLKLKTMGVIEGLQSIITELNVQYERKGNFEEQKRLLIESSERLDEYKKEYADINSGLLSKQQLISNRIKDFNNYFSKLSKTLYDEEFILVDEYSDRAMSLKVDTISTNPGTGKKKGQIAAFDLAYIQFADDLGIDCLHFILQDQLETVHTNQLSSLFTQIVENINCQYIMTILKDSLPTDIDTTPYTILKLSQNCKLFRL
jgi:Uncharacterized protein conserved in bacteria (DUF2326).